jgi:Transposase DDE domain
MCAERSVGSVPRCNAQGSLCRHMMSLLTPLADAQPLVVGKERLDPHLALIKPRQPSTALSRPRATPVRSKPSVPPATTAAKSTAISPKAIWKANALTTRRQRKAWVEPLFAEAKEWHGLRRFRLRCLWRVNCAALLIAAGQNLKRLLNRRGWGRRPPPSGAALVAKQSESALMCLLVLVILIGPRHYLDRRTHVSRWAE